MNWVIVAALVILAFVFLRIKHFKHKLILVFLIIALLFVYASGSRILSGHEIEWRTTEGWGDAATLYAGWLGGVFDNLKVITTNAIKMDWSRNVSEDIKIEERK